MFCHGQRLEHVRFVRGSNTLRAPVGGELSCGFRQYFFFLVFGVCIKSQIFASESDVGLKLVGVAAQSGRLFKDHFGSTHPYPFVMEAI